MSSISFSLLDSLQRVQFNFGRYMRYWFVFFCFFLTYFVLQWWKLVPSKTRPKYTQNRVEPANLVGSFCETIFSLPFHSVPLFYTVYGLWLILGLCWFGIEHLLIYRTKYTQNQEDHLVGAIRETIFSLYPHFLTTIIAPFFCPFFSFFFLNFYYYVLKFVFHFVWFVWFCSALFSFISWPLTSSESSRLYFT